MSSPKNWPDDKRAAHKVMTFDTIRGVLGAGHSILIFPAGKVRRQENEIVEPYLSGVHEILRAAPDTPVLLLRLDGLGAFQPAQYDGFWSFLGIKKGRRHVQMDIRPVKDLDPSQDLAPFNARLETLLNAPISKDM